MPLPFWKRRKFKPEDVVGYQPNLVVVIRTWTPYINYFKTVCPLKHSSYSGNEKNKV